ncbi:MAG: hypothetical protein AAFY88_14530, partial [Acidobacteriota bacterium]
MRKKSFPLLSEYLNVTRRDTAPSVDEVLLLLTVKVICPGLGAWLESLSTFTQILLTNSLFVVPIVKEALPHHHPSRNSCETLAATGAMSSEQRSPPMFHRSSSM